MIASERTNSSFAFWDFMDFSPPPNIFNPWLVGFADKEGSILYIWTLRAKWEF